MSKNHNEDPRPFVIVRFVEGVKQYFASNDNEDDFWGTDIRFADRWHEDQARDVANGVGESAHPLRVKPHVALPYENLYREMQEEQGAIIFALDSFNGEWIVDAAKRVASDRDVARASIRAAGEAMGYHSSDLGDAVRKIVVERDSLAVQRNSLAVQLRHSKTQHSAENERAEKAIERLAFEVKRVDEAEAKLAAAEKERDEARDKLHYQATEWEALIEPRNRAVARERALEAKFAAMTKLRDMANSDLYRDGAKLADTVDERDRALSRLSVANDAAAAAEKRVAVLSEQLERAYAVDPCDKCAAAAAKVRAERDEQKSKAAAWEAQSNRNLERCEELARELREPKKELDAAITEGDRQRERAEKAEREAKALKVQVERQREMVEGAWQARAAGVSELRELRAALAKLASGGAGAA